MNRVCLLSQSPGVELSRSLPAIRSHNTLTEQILYFLQVISWAVLPSWTLLHNPRALTKHLQGFGQTEKYKGIILRHDHSWFMLEGKRVTILHAISSLSENIGNCTGSILRQRALVQLSGFTTSAQCSRTEAGSPTRATFEYHQRPNVASGLKLTCLCPHNLHHLSRV